MMSPLSEFIAKVLHAQKLDTKLPESPIERPIPKVPNTNISIPEPVKEVTIEAPKSETAKERMSSTEIYQDLQNKKAWYRGLDKEIRLAQDEVNQVRQRGLAVSWGRNPPGMLASAAGAGGVAAIDHAKRRGSDKFTEYRVQKKLAEERLSELTKLKPQLEQEIRDLEIKFSAAVRIESAESDVSQLS